ncbi:uncharacterized protein [Malus domestica]|uniref:uncharacterized protein n=1 Tax=Malus domestica TaxID=3750 RepID=UPI0039763832
MSSSRRVYKQLQEQQKKLLAQQAELANIKEGGGIDKAFFMEEDEDDHHRRQRASHSHRVMEVVGQIAKLTRAANLDRKRERREDAFHVLGLIREQKITAFFRMLAYGASVDQVDEIARMGKTTVMESLMRFCSAIEALYTNEYLRTPTPRDMRRLLRKGEMRGFPGMIGSIDCMYWTWKNCPSAWQGAYGDIKCAKNIILETVASFDTWIWHAFFGVLGAQNDLNVLAQSPVFDCCKENRRDAHIVLMVPNTRDHTTLQMAFTQGGQRLSK